MTYCVAMSLDAGLVFLSDSRTNAGVDQVSSFRKMTVFERPEERMIVLMTAGNLAISQSVRQVLSERVMEGGRSIWNAPNMFEAVSIVGEAVRQVHERDFQALQDSGVDFNVSLIFGGQIRGGPCRLFSVYAAGNFIEAQAESCYFQIGESKYGKPIVDRVVTPALPLDEAAKCALISMDSTLRSNISVGLPLDLLVYEKDSLRVTRFAQIDQANQYFNMIHTTWGKRLRQVFAEIPDPSWSEEADDLVQMGAVSISEGRAHQPVRAPMPPGTEPAPLRASPIQTLAQSVRLRVPQ
jgi:putative proteasome-type protease